jgi:hypothetical protein
MPQFGCVFGISKERDLGGTGLFHSSHAGDFDIRVAPKFAAQPSREIAQKDALNGGHRMALLYRSALKAFYPRLDAGIRIELHETPGFSNGLDRRCGCFRRAVHFRDGNRLV